MTDVQMIPTRVNGRWDLVLPEHRAVRPEWYTDAGWERARLDSMHEHLTRLVERNQARERALAGALDVPEDLLVSAPIRPVIIDVGVEEGDLTALYSQWGCDVVMVEPNPRVWPNVRAIWQANGLRMPVSGWVGFAGDHDDPMDAPHVDAWLREHVRVTAPEAGDDGWPLCAHGPVIGDHAFLHLAQHAHMVPSVTLDTLIRDGNWNGQALKADAITMDVEGSELRVLRGAERILREDRPLVWVSVHTDDQWMTENYAQDRRGDIDAFMGGLGYVPELLAVDHEEHVAYFPDGYER
jgi:FkbM family methyltransferase